MGHSRTRKIRNAEGVVIAYDVTNSESFDNLKFWISSIKTNLFEKNIFIPIIIIGNKIDLEDMRDISKDVASAFAKENNFKYFETSAKTGEGVDEAFRDLVNQILANSDKNEEATIERKSVKIEEKKTEKQKKKGREFSDMGNQVPTFCDKSLEELLPFHYLNEQGIEALKEDLWLFKAR